MIDEGVNYDVHDWPTAELGLKLGGFVHLRNTGEDIAEFEEEMFSADEQSDVEEASQEAPVEKGADVDMT